MTNPTVCPLVILNNYFHDVATATLLSSAVIVYVLSRQARKGGVAERKALARAYRTLTRFGWGALAWIMGGGILRTIFFKVAEFILAAEKNIVPDLLVKHVVLVSAVVAGSVLWVRIRKMARFRLRVTPNNSARAPWCRSTPS